MSIVVHKMLLQGSDDWFAARCGLLTASEMKLIMTGEGAPASNDKERAHLYELAAQRITRYVEPTFVSFDMERGKVDENEALSLYSQNIAPLEPCGFITNDEWGFTLGYSPDALVRDDGLVECKSRRQRFQVETFVKYAGSGKIPPDYSLQIQTGLLVSKRKWCDFISYSGGLPMAVVRVFPDCKMQDAIIAAASAFEARLRTVIDNYTDTVAALSPIPTERIIQQEMYT